MLGGRDIASDFPVLRRVSCGCNAFNLLSSALFGRAKYKHLGHAETVGIDLASPSPIAEMDKSSGQIPHLVATPSGSCYIVSGAPRAPRVNDWSTQPSIGRGNDL
jgi:hypothetical protein